MTVVLKSYDELNAEQQLAWTMGHEAARPELLMAIEFRPPAKIWSTNMRINHYERAELTRSWKGAVRLLAGRYRNLPPGIVRIWLPFTDVRRRDPHNYCGTVLKAIIDGLVMAGCWPDDTPEWVGHREPVIYKGKDVLVEVWRKSP